VVADLFFATGDEGDFRGDGRLRGGAALVLESRYPTGSLSMEAGYRFRPTRDFAGLSVGDEALLRLASRYAIATELELVPEWEGRLTTPNGEATELAQELRAGLATRARDGWSVSAGMGVGFGAAIGRPAFRYLLGLNYTAPPDADRDGDETAPPLRERDADTERDGHALGDGDVLDDHDVLDDSTEKLDDDDEEGVTLAEVAVDGVADGVTLSVLGDGDGVTSVEALPEVPDLLLAHNPKAFPAAARLGIPLTLAGHTHGGQVALRDRPQANLSLLHRHSRGLYSRGGSRLFVNVGAGAWFPLRRNVPAEIVMLTLRRA
jgi:hypothetical protein